MGLCGSGAQICGADVFEAEFECHGDAGILQVVQLQWMLIVKETFAVTRGHNVYNWTLWICSSVLE